MSAVYATVMNLSILDTSILLVLITLAGAFFQWPIGSVSDNFDRRKVIILCAFFGVVFYAIVCYKCLDVVPCEISSS